MFFHFLSNVNPPPKASKFRQVQKNRPKLHVKFGRYFRQQQVCHVDTYYSEMIVSNSGKYDI